MKTKKVFWQGANLEVAQLCEAKGCRLLYDVLQGLFFVVRKHGDGSVHHDRGTHVTQSKNVETIRKFINNY